MSNRIPLPPADWGIHQDIDRVKEDDDQDMAIRGIRDLPPGYFALVMATGIVSTAADIHGMHAIARWLLLLNTIFYAVLVFATAARLSFYRAQFREDLLNHTRAPGFFTIVAGTCQLGAALALINGDYGIAKIFWIAALILWPVLLYVFLTILCVIANKPDYHSAINGGWLIACVSTQSVSILGSILLAHRPEAGESVLLLNLMLYFVGVLLYLILITLIVYRLIFLKLSPQDFTLNHWIMMGAAAISALAGSRLILSSGGALFMTGILPALKALTLMFWAIATWWIPFLATLTLWRYLVGHYPLRYEPDFWTFVFPIGMYSTSSFYLGKTEGLLLPAIISHYFVFIALAAWIVAFAAMSLSLLRRLLAGRNSGRMPLG